MEFNKNDFKQGDLLIDLLVVNLIVDSESVRIDNIVSIKKQISNIDTMTKILEDSKKLDERIYIRKAEILLYLLNKARELNYDFSFYDFPIPKHSYYALDLANAENIIEEELLASNTNEEKLEIIKDYYNGILEQQISSYSNIVNRKLDDIIPPSESQKRVNAIIDEMHNNRVDIKDYSDINEYAAKVQEATEKDNELFDKLQEEWDKEWKKFEKEHEQLPKVENVAQPKVNKSNVDVDKLISDIDKKLEELENKESLEKNRQDYNNWKNEVLARINNEEYQTIEEAKAKAKIIIKNENDLTSVWEKDQKYYVVLSKDREVAFRNNFKEVVKYYELTSENKNSVTTKNNLVRNNLSEFYGYHSKNNIDDKNSTLEYINKINSILSNYSFVSDENFVLLGRKKFIYDEICEILSGTKIVDNPLYFVLGSLEEFICNNNFVYMSDSEHWEKGWEDLRNRNDIYSQKNIICLEEKNVIEDIINRIKSYILNNDKIN